MTDLSAFFPDVVSEKKSGRSRPDYYSRCGPGKRPKFAAFDFETDGLGGPVIAATLITERMMDESEEPIYIFRGDILQQVFDFMCEHHEYQWFAHNAQYEFRYFIDRLKDMGDRVQFFMRTDSDVFMLKVSLPEFGDKAVLTMRDSLALWLGTLEEFTNSMCPELAKLKRKETFDERPFDPFDDEDIRYAKRDSLSLLLALVRFDEKVFAAFDIHIRSTVASTALAAWQRTLGRDDKYYNSKNDEEFIRRGYYGGLVFLTDTRKISGAKSFDRNSSYPAEMIAGNFPEGYPVKIRGMIDPDRLGIYDVTISAPDDLVIPIVPVRDKNGIVWPSGIFRTTITNEEIEYATANGYKVLEIHEGKIWEKSCSPFHTFVSKCVALRTEFKGTDLEIVVKRIQNSLYGKFGSKRVRRKIYTSLPEDEVIGCTPWGDFLIREEVAEDMQCMPQWAVFITARARLALLKEVYKAGPENCLYGDTDSITLRPGHEMPQGLLYGEWKLDKSWEEFRARGPKVYAGQKTAKLTGLSPWLPTEASGAAKGIPQRHWKTSGVFGNIIEGTTGEPIQFKTLERFTQALKTGYTGQHDAHRTLSTLDNSRSWKRREDGSVRPRTWQEIQERTAGARGGHDLQERDSVAVRRPRARGRLEKVA